MSARNRHLWALGQFLVAVALTSPVLLHAQQPEPQWTGGGPDIGWVTTLHRFHPAASIYAGTKMGGVFRSDDGGLTWNDVTGNLRGSDITDLEAAFGGGNGELYASTIDFGISRNDNFASDRWTPINAGLDFGFGPDQVYSIAVHPHDLDMVTIGTSRGVRTSNDRGRAWADSLGWLEAPIVDVAVSPLAPNTIFAVEATRHLMRSWNHGASVDTVAFGDAALLEVELWAGASLDTMLVLGDDGVYQSFDGRNFELQLPWGDPGAPHGRVRDLELVPGGETAYLAADRDLWVTNDLGSTWSEIDHDLGRFAELKTVMVDDPQTQTLLIGSATNGVLGSGPNASQLQRQNTGLRAGIVVGVEAWGDEVLISTLHGRIYYSDDTGKSWQDRTGDLDIINANEVRRVPSLSRLVVGSGRRDFWLSDDDGQTWRKPDSYHGPNQVNGIHGVPWEDDTNLYALTSEGLYESTDGGVVWERNVDIDQARSLIGFGVAEDDQSVWIATRNITGANPEAAALYRRQLGGTFEMVEVVGDLGNFYQAVAFPLNEGSYVLLGTDKGVFALLEQPDGSMDSINITGGLPGQFGMANIWDLAVDHERGIYYAGLFSGGIYRSANDGESWEAFNEGITFPTVMTLEMARDRNQPRLYAGTFGRGVYGRTLDTSVSVLLDRPRVERQGRGVRVSLRRSGAGRLELWRSVDDDPTQRLGHWYDLDTVAFYDDLDAVDLEHGAHLRYEARVTRSGEMVAASAVDFVIQPVTDWGWVTQMHPNLPNPFNPSTLLRLELAESAEVQVQIYDVRGRHVTELFRGPLEPGQHRFRWTALDASGTPLASGVYLSRIQVGSRVLTGRMTLLR